MIRDRTDVDLSANSPPHDPIVASVPFFYGWVMLPIAIAGHIATSPGQTYGISVFNDSFRQELGLSRTALTGAYMLGTLLAAFPVAYVGACMDRYGIRRAMSAVVVLFGATCVATSQVRGLLTLFLAFFMLRMLGQGALSLLSSNTVAMWFHARLGTASGLMSLGTAVAFAAVPATNLYLIDRFGWRFTYALLGIAVWVVMLPLMAVFFRNRPEDIGQVPDGVRVRAATESELHRGDLDCDLTLRQALRSRAYWILLCMHIVWALVSTAIVFSIVDLFADHGLSKGEVAMFFTYFACSMAAAQFGGGLLADRYPLHFLLFVAQSGMTLSVAYLTRLDSAQSAIAFAVALGASQGLFIVLGQTVWARYYGRAHLGRIRGTAWTASVAGSSLGPFALGVTKDLCGAYTPAIWLFVAMYGILSVTALFATPPARPLG